MPTVYSVGSVNVDRVASVDHGTIETLAARYPWFPAPGETARVDAIPDALDDYVTEVLLGGKGANQAVAAARAGVDAGLVGAVGTDHERQAVLETLSRYGVDVSEVMVADAPTGTAYVFVDPDGESYIAILAGANGAVDAASVRARRETILAADVVLVQNELPTAATRAVLALVEDRPPERRPTVVLDPAPADGAERLVGHPAVDVLKPNDVEYAALADPLVGVEATLVRTRGERSVIVEPGPNAAERLGVAVPQGPFEVVPPPVDPVDATGAGDVFAGFLAAELSRGTDLRSAVEVGTAAAALSTEREGVQRATPDREAVAAFRAA